MAPSWVSQGGGRLVWVHGSGFSHVTGCLIGGAESAGVVHSDALVVCEAPALAGVSEATVQLVCGSESCARPDQGGVTVSVVHEPEAASVTPAEGSAEGGTVLVVGGRHLAATSGRAQL